MFRRSRSLGRRSRLWGCISGTLLSRVRGQSKSKKGVFGRCRMVRNITATYLPRRDVGLTHEDVLCSRTVTPDFKQLHQIKELAVDITTYL